MPRRRAGQCSSASGMPAAHSPPIPIPKSARKPKSMAYEVEKPLRHAKIENQSIDSISGSLRPYLSGHRACNHATNQAKEQRYSAEGSGECAVYRKALLNIKKNEGQNGEVEAVEHPPQKSGEERLPLLPVDLSIPREGRIDLSHLLLMIPFSVGLVGGESNICATTSRSGEAS